MTTLPERILSGEVEAPDLFCGGTPCQAFSVAGLRNSLDDARGNLSLTFVGIANAIDHVRAVRSASPAIVFWENVPGVLSTKDNAFGCFLGALAGEDEPIIPPGEKWTNAGCVYGPQRAVAWRVLDAQYFGVAQRRRRVFVVASARADFDPAAVLFEFDSVRRDTAPSRETGKEAASGAGASIVGSLDTECGGGKLTHQSVANGHLIGTITARMFNALGPRDVASGAIMPVVSPALNTCSGSHHAPDTKAYVVHGTQDPCVSDIAFAQGRNNGGENVLAQPIPLNSMNVLRSADADPTTGCGIGEAGEAMFTLTKGQHHAVAQPISIQDVRPVEKAQNGKGWNDEGTAYTVDTHATQGVAQPMTFAETAQTITAGFGFDYNDEKKAASHLVGMQVRRLTPVECERLQGFPDNYTNIPWRKKPEAPDGPRYKALGNSWAVPNVRWIGQRIADHLNPPD
jgi:DNA (cytosine-5)-methyltransferase 1